MRHLRTDYDAIQPWPVKRRHHVKVDGELVLDLEDLTDVGATDESVQPLIGDDEPVFLLRARDPSAPAALRVWARDNLDRGRDWVLYDAVRAYADEMEAWAEAHGGAKVADTPHDLLDPR